MDITAHAPDTDHVEGVLIGLIIAAAVLSRPIESRLWRAGRLSDRALAALLVARFPIVFGLFALIRGMPAPLLLLIVAGTAGVAAVAHPFVLTAIEDQARSRSPRGS